MPLPPTSIPPDAQIDGARTPEAPAAPPIAGLETQEVALEDWLAAGGERRRRSRLPGFFIA